ncbi:hypothetical protein [Curtobacterium flaccumfaciens]|uniref:hypothetical protein n=1 Tax=Curtobacterium flaccumfaciens TaxID=2035 RepID=UPI002659DDC7|nr:hypothetical protein [Curtobacterium flaccumfaciens]MCS5505193.1 hypothetical protein [Curtobacterium flaccumfaciens pv. flaccumfaciens]
MTSVLLNAVVAVLVVTAALALTSLDRRTAVLLGATGSLTGTFLTWVAVPRLFEQSLLAPWVAAALGTALLIAGWSAVRAYSGIFEAPRDEEPETGALMTVGGSAQSLR